MEKKANDQIGKTTQELEEKIDDLEGKGLLTKAEKESIINAILTVSFADVGAPDESIEIDFNTDGINNNTPSTPTTYNITYDYLQGYVSISNTQGTINSGETYTTIITATYPNNVRFNGYDIFVEMGDDHLLGDSEPNEEYLVDISEDPEVGIQYRLTIPNVNGDISIACDPQWAY